jgi:transcriptional regulator GlxA family with amidase domain
VSGLQFVSADVGHVRDEVIRALEYMEREHESSITLDDIAGAASLSPRRPQEVFRAHDLESPLAGLRQIRLQHARQLLLDPAERRSIKEIAGAEQLFHFARFSSRYEATFGELPSATIARVRSGKRAPFDEPTRGHFDARTMEYREA